MSRTVLIGLDGATFSILDPLMQEGVMPFMSEFTSRGVRGDLLSTPLPLTAQAWPALFTGRSPGNHGVFDFVRVERARERPTYTLSTSTDLRCETIWSIASRQDRTVLSLNFPLMFPPQPLNGYMVAGFVPWRHLRRAVYPRDLYERLQALPGFDPKELALDYDLEKRAIQSLPEDEYEDWIRLHIRREERWFEIARSLLTEDPCDLTAILFDGMDKLQHVCWRLLDPALLPEEPSPWERKMRDLCLDYFRRLDSLLAELVALAGRDARVFMASDHGFGPTDQIFYANEWLERNGYLAWSEGVPVDREGMLHAEGHRSTVVLFDWDRTAAYALTPSSNGIFIDVTEDPARPGVPPDEYVAFRSRLSESLLGLTDPATGQPVVKRVMTREEAFPGAHMHRAPDLTLALRDHGFISVVRAEQPVRRRPWIDGTHRPEGVFIAGGEGIQAGLSLPPLSIMDVAPALLYSLDLPIPEDLEGRLASEIFEPSFIEATPPRPGEPTLSLDGGPVEQPEISAEEEAQLVEQLRVLGYLE
ncbi:MAG: alkaline phosphatase family protein [Actinomycetota bacterium]|nr:alkaline phosphatase family protein [Actinomycetota bacterium]